MPKINRDLKTKDPQNRNAKMDGCTVADSPILQVSIVSTGWVYLLYSIGISIPIQLAISISKRDTPRPAWRGIRIRWFFSAPPSPWVVWEKNQPHRTLPPVPRPLRRMYQIDLTRPVPRPPSPRRDWTRPQPSALPTRAKRNRPFEGRGRRAVPTNSPH